MPQYSLISRLKDHRWQERSNMIDYKKTKNAIIELKYNLFLFLIIVALIGVNYGCTSSIYKPKKLSILPLVPMSRTSVASYISIETVYKSDKQIVLLTLWETVFDSKKHNLRWEILNSKGDKIFSKINENVTIESNTYFHLTVPLKGDISTGLIPGELTVNIYVDDVLAKTQKTNYAEKSITSKKSKCVVILPFVEKCDVPSPWNKRARYSFQNTIADGIYGEVKRIFPDTIPHSVVEQKVGKLYKPDCFDNRACANFVKDQFGDCIFIYGNMWMQQIYLDSSYVTLWVFDLKTGLKKKFHSSQRYRDTFTRLQNTLLKGLLYKGGLLEYLQDF